MKPTQSTFQTTQQQFCDWIRNPELAMPATFQADRMQVYRDLLFNNVCSFINLVFPVARSMLPELLWQQLLIEFFQKAQCQSPLYNDISLQFREYLTDQHHSVLQQYPWLAELLQFEWLELYLDTAEIEVPSLVQDQDWQLTTQVWVLVYQYPVYQWTAAMTASEVQPMPSAIMAWRNAQDQVCIEVLSPLFAMLIEQLNQNASLGEQDIQHLITSVLPEFSRQEIHLQIDTLKTLLTRLGLIHIPNLPHEKHG